MLFPIILKDNGNDDNNNNDGQMMLQAETQIHQRHRDDRHDKDTIALSRPTIQVHLVSVGGAAGAHCFLRCRCGCSHR